MSTADAQTAATVQTAAAKTTLVACTLISLAAQTTRQILTNFAVFIAFLLVLQKRDYYSNQFLQISYKIPTKL